MDLSAETIAAPINAPGHAPVSAVRLSGPAVVKILKHSFSAAKNALSSPRELVFGRIYFVDEKLARNSLDQGMVVFFPGPKSFTGEDCAEFHLHGSPHLVGELLRSFEGLGARMAKAGEFSARAFENGRIDLTQAEAISDLIAAETASQAHAAREQLEGKLARALEKVGEPLRDLLAEIEAQIDFPEEDIPPEQRTAWIKTLRHIIEETTSLRDSYSVGRLFRDGALVVLAGLPNAGKSSLLNRLLGEQRVIVHPQAGTTRDSIEEKVSINGLCVRLCDTAGIFGPDQDGFSELDRQGQEVSWRRIEQAELVLLLIDASKELDRSLAESEGILEKARSSLILLNKVDLLSDEAKESIRAKLSRRQTVLISALTGENCGALRGEIYRKLLDSESRPLGEAVVVTTERHYSALREACRVLSAALDELGSDRESEVIAFELREALLSLQEIVGVTSNEDILGKIFSKFCIGK